MNTHKDNNNNTSATEYDSNSSSKYLNNFVNISNGPPELIDYYDLDSGGVGGGLLDDDGERPSQSPEIYPDPETIHIKEHHGTNVVVPASSSVVVTEMLETNFEMVSKTMLEGRMHNLYIMRIYI